MAGAGSRALSRRIQFKAILRAELKRQDLGYVQDAAKLVKIGVTRGAHELRSKVGGGGFSAVFFVQSMRII